MAWTIEIEDQVARQIKRLGHPVSERITRFLRQRLMAFDDPRSIGKALRGSTLGDYWSYRVGDYRIVCDIQHQRLVVMVVGVGHRREIYR